MNTQLAAISVLTFLLGCSTDPQSIPSMEGTWEVSIEHKFSDWPGSDTSSKKSIWLITQKLDSIFLAFSPSGGKIPGSIELDGSFHITRGVIEHTVMIADTPRIVANLIHYTGKLETGWRSFTGMYQFLYDDSRYIPPGMKHGDAALEFTLSGTRK